MTTFLVILLLLAVAAGVWFWFQKKNQEEEETSDPWAEEQAKEKALLSMGPRIIGLGLGASFDVDPLMLRLYNDDLVTDGAESTHIIQASGVVDWNDTKVHRFYTDDDAWLQVVSQGPEEEDIVDLKLFHYYDTVNIGTQEEWDDLLTRRIGNETYELEGHTYTRVWESTARYHNPVHMREHTYTKDGSCSETDQFVMLFERKVNDDCYESLFVSAEEVETPSGVLERCLVLSTGISLNLSQITIHG